MLLKDKGRANNPAFYLPMMKSCYHILITPTAVAIADLTRYEKGMLITRINVPDKFRQRGYGTFLLKLLTDEADKNATILYLEVAPSGNMSYQDLVVWYKKHGFKESRGIMVRRPRDLNEQTKDGDSFD